MKNPKSVLIYVADYDNKENKPIYGVCEKLEEIPYDVEDQVVATYRLESVGLLKIDRRIHLKKIVK